MHLPHHICTTAPQPVLGPSPSPLRPVPLPSHFPVTSCITVSQSVHGRPPPRPHSILSHPSTHLCALPFINFYYLFRSSPRVPLSYILYVLRSSHCVPQYSLQSPYSGVGKMAQEVKTLNTKSHSFRVILGTHMVICVILRCHRCSGAHTWGAHDTI